MTFMLLTGAGFSHNWGAPLASQVFSSVLSDRDIDGETRERLIASGGAFEGVMADFQISSDPEDQKRYEALLTSVVGIFNGMNQSFMQTQFEFENPPSVQHSMAAFLSRFHAIFTLNQDTLLEQHYNPHIGPPMNWGHLQCPGMRYMQPYTPTGSRHDKFAIMEPHPPFHHLRERRAALRETPRFRELGRVQSRQAHHHHGRCKSRQHRPLSGFDLVPR